MTKYVFKRYIDAGPLVSVKGGEFNGDPTGTVISITYWNSEENADRTIPMDGTIYLEDGPQPGDMVMESKDSVWWCTPEQFKRDFSAV